MSKRVRRRYLFPCTGFVSSVKKILAPLTAITSDSRDCLLMPQDGRVVGRAGSALQWDLNSGTSYVHLGLLEDKWSARARQLFGLKSPQATDNLPSPAVLYTNEAAGTRFGNLFLRETTGGSNYRLGREFSATTYPQTVTTAVQFKMTPLPYSCGTASAGATGLTRDVNALNRRFNFPGSRRLARVGRHLFGPNLYGCPIKWNQDFNPSTAGGSRVNRIAPWGHVPPLWPPTLGALPAATVGTTDKNWKAGDTFYFAVIFKFEDGSYSMPTVPRPVSSVLTSGFGFVQVGTPQARNAPIFYPHLTYNDITRGPDGCVARLIARTNKVTIVTDTDTPTLDQVDISKLRVTALIPNNSQTSYTDPNGNDNSLAPDNGLVVRWDHTWAPCGRYAFEFDQRIAIGYTRTNSAAIVISPSGVAASRDQNGDDSVTTGSTAFLYRVESGLLRLRYLASYPGDPATGPNSQRTIAIGSGVTLQSLVDQINAGGVGLGGKQWAAQIVPGADPNATTDNLALTVINVANCTAAGTTLTTSNSFVDVAVGMLVSGTGVPAATYVTAKASNTSLTLSQAATSSGVALNFSADTGDDFLVTDGSWGNVRVYNNAVFGVIPFKASYVEVLNGYEDKRAVWFTVASPGAAPLAPQSFVVGNRRAAPADAGIFMGGGPLTNGALCIYSEAIYVLQNRRGGTSGEDFDYRLYPLNKRRGCIAWDSIVVGDGWIGYLTRDGYVVCDGERERIITSDIWHPGERRGELDYEIIQSAKGVAADDDSSHFHGAVSKGRLHITYRSSSSFAYPDRRQVYDFTQGAEGSGLDEVMRAVGSEGAAGRSYGWSPPLLQRASVMGAVDLADGTHLYGTVEDNAGTTGDGRVDELDTGTLDTGTAVTVGPSPWSLGVQTLTGSAGTFARVAVGAIIAGTVPAGLLAGMSVTAKAADDSSVTLSDVTSSSGSGNVTFYGQDIQPIAYCTMDQVGEVRNLKKCHRATVLYRNTGSPNSTLSLLMSRRADRTGQATYSLPAHTVSDEQARKLVQMTQASRQAGQVIEFAVSHNGNGGVAPELVGIDAEIEVLESKI